jgi:hypothetical protein
LGEPGESFLDIQVGLRDEHRPEPHPLEEGRVHDQHPVSLADIFAIGPDCLGGSLACLPAVPVTFPDPLGVVGRPSGLSSLCRLRCEVGEQVDGDRGPLGRGQVAAEVEGEDHVADFVGRAVPHPDLRADAGLAGGPVAGPSVDHLPVVNPDREQDAAGTDVVGEGWAFLAGGREKASG